MILLFVLGMLLLFSLALWAADIGTDFLDRMERARNHSPTLFDWEEHEHAL